MWHHKEPVLKGYALRGINAQKPLRKVRIKYTQTKENIILTKEHTLNDVLCAEFQ
jgi:hypothetical protein